MIGISGLNIVGEDKSTMFRTYGAPLPIRPRWFEFTLSNSHIGNLGVASSRGEEHDARGTICLNTYMMREDAMESGYPLVSVRAPIQ